MGWGEGGGQAEEWGRYSTIVVIERITKNPNPEIQNLFFFFFVFFNSKPGFFLFSFFFECVIGGRGCRVRRQGARGGVARGVGAFFLKRELLYQPNTH